MDDKMAFNGEYCFPICTKSWWIKLLSLVLLGGDCPNRSPSGSVPGCSSMHFNMFWLLGIYIVNGGGHIQKSNLDCCSETKIVRENALMYFCNLAHWNLLLLQLILVLSHFLILVGTNCGCLVLGELLRAC